jgi:hypothetical protein
LNDYHDFLKHLNKSSINCPGYIHSGLNLNLHSSPQELSIEIRTAIMAITALALFSAF